MRNIFSRTLQTTIIFLIAGGVVALALGGYFSSASNVFTGSLVNVQTWFATRFSAVQDFLTAPRDMAFLRQHNTELESEVSNLQAQVIQLQQQVGETQSLRALLNFAQANPENQYKGAAVIGQDPSPFLHYVIINRGSNDGIRRGMPVVTDQGLVGRIDSVIADAARVQLITDPASTVNVRLQNAEAEATLSGSITSELNLSMIPQNQDTNKKIQSGDLVLTSGLGGGYPGNLIIGQVGNVSTSEVDLFQQANVQPVVDFNHLPVVLVITNFQPVDFSPLVTPSP